MSAGGRMGRSVPGGRRGREGGDFGPTLKAEWTKFRTVRGWVTGLVVAGLCCVGFTFLSSNGSQSGICNGPPPANAGPNSPGLDCRPGHPFVPTGPNGEPVADSYYLVHRELTGNGVITVRVVSLGGLTSTNSSNVAPSLAHTRPGLSGWAKAGILVTPDARQGSAYAAIMATGNHGVHWQYDYTHDASGLSRSVTPESPVWLRLVRSGQTLTGYDSADGAHWSRVESTRMALPNTVTVGLFVTSPASFLSTDNGLATDATARFDRVSTTGSVVGRWSGEAIGVGGQSFYPTLGAGGFHRAGNSYVISGTGDISIGVGAILLGADTSGTILLVGLFVALLVMIVLASLFITTEYRRGLIRTTFTAIPNRGHVVAAKAVVIGGICLVTGAVAAAIALPLGAHVLNSNGNYVFPTDPLGQLWVVAGVAAVLGLTAVAVLSLGAILRRGAGAVTAGVVLFVLPYILGQLLSGSAQAWIFRLTPAAGYSVLGVLPRSAVVAYPYTLANGYYPLAPWDGLLVLCAYAGLALWLASYVVRRRDA